MSEFINDKFEISSDKEVSDEELIKTGLDLIHGQRITRSGVKQQSDFALIIVHK